jgi:hypothetical protein
MKFPKRLICTETCELVQIDDACGDYCVVSYVWGQGKFKNKICNKFVNDSTLNALHTGLLVARLNNIKWLWIDAICIHQDDPDDKAKEVGKMGAYYSNAEICIVVVNELANIMDECRIIKPYRNYPDNPDQTLIEAYTKVNHALNESSWMTRGWTLQESLLPRTLVFTSITLALLDIVIDAETISLLQALTPNMETSRIVKLCDNRFVRDVVKTPVITWLGEMKRRQCSIEEDTIYCILGLATTKTIHDIEYGVDLINAFKKLCRIALNNNSRNFLSYSLENFCHLKHFT